MDEVKEALQAQAEAMSGAMKGAAGGAALPPNQGVPSGRERSARIGEGAHRHRDIDALSVPTTDLLTQFGISAETLAFQRWYNDQFTVKVDNAAGHITITPKDGKLPLSDAQELLATTYGRLMSLQVKARLAKSADADKASQGHRASSLLKEYYWKYGTSDLALIAGSMIKEVDERRRQESALSDFALITSSEADITGYFGGSKKRPDPIGGASLQTLLPY